MASEEEAKVASVASRSLIARHRAVTLHELRRLLGDWRQSPGPLHDRLSRRLGQLLADGRVAPGARLPAERRVADELAISRTTVARSYATLREQGLLESRRGAGSVTRLNGSALTGFVEWAGASRLERPGTAMVDLSKAAPGADADVIAVLRATAEQAEMLLGDTGYHPLGLENLRSQIAARYTGRGLPTTSAQVLVTAGAQQAVDLLLRTFVRRREAVIVESPTYPAALDSLRLAGARIVGLDVSTAAWRLGALDDLIEQTGAQFAYLIPDFQNPTGHLMDDADRAALVRICRSRGVMLLIDETLVEVALDPRTSPRPVACHDRADTVLSIGSLSKAVWAGLRVGWIRASAQQIAAVARTRTAADLSGAPFEQLAGALLMADLDSLLERRRGALVAQRDAVIDAATDAGWTTVAPGGGLSSWIRLPHGSASQLADVCYQQGIILTPGPRLSPDGALDRYLRLPYSLPADALTDAVGRVASAWRATDGGAYAPDISPIV